MNKKPASHYLKDELDTLLKGDSKIFDFLESCSLDGVWYWDLQSPEHEWLSPNFWTTLGYDPAKKQHLAAEWQDLIHPEDLKTALANFNEHCQDADHPYDQIVRYRHKNGSVVWVRCRGIAIRDDLGKPIRMLGAHNDITKIKEMEIAEVKIRKEHELKLAHLLRVHGMAELAHGMAHQINQPLSSIVQYAGGCLIKLKQQNVDDEIINIIQKISDQAEKCGHIINSMRAFLKPSGIKKIKVDLNDLLNTAINFLSHDLDQTGINLILQLFKEPVTIIADKIQIEQVVLNIMSNAINAMKHDSVVERNLRIETNINASQSAELIISDTGIGIKEENLDNIYEAFFTMSTMGMGMGLAISRSIVEAHGGKIGVVSQLKKGAKFTITLPLS